MSKIDPKALEKARKAKNWSQAKLAEECKIDKATVWRIEKGRTENVRPGVLEKLSRKLDQSPEVLTGKAQYPEKTTEPDGLLERTQLNLRVGGSARNQLALVAMRYQVTQAQIVELAPFLFHCAAQQSLKRRKEQHAQMLAAVKAAAALSRESPHLPSELGSYRMQADILSAELSSIEQEHIFGQSIEAELEDADLNYSDDVVDSPFETFLRKMSTDIKDADFSGWSSTPDYEVCRSLALKLVGGDEKAASAVLGGSALLHELPPELRKSGQEAERAQWAHLKAEESLRKLEERFPGIGQIIDEMSGEKGTTT